jgi:hypothetical protein
MNIPKPLEAVVPLLAGGLAAAYLNTLTGWWLNSGTGVAAMVATLFVLAVFFACLGAAPWIRAGSLWTGAMVGLTTCLFWMGPGTIWPIVLVVAACMTAVTVVLGTGVGAFLHRVVHTRA